MPQAVSYIRFSSLPQGKGSSVARQADLFEQWLTKHPEYTASSLKAVDQGVSAFKGDHKRAGLGELLRAVEDGRIKADDAIVIEAIDRITREEAADALPKVTEIIRAGIRIYTIEDDAVYDRHSIQSAALYVLAAKIHASYEYSKRLSTRIQEAYKIKREKAKAGQFIKAPNRPFWIGQNGLLIENAANAVRRAIHLYREGEGQLAVLKKIRAEFPDVTEFPESVRSIKRLLTNEALVGHWDGVKAFEPAISFVEYLELKQLVDQRTTYNKPEEKYLLSGLIVCKQCGASYNFRRQKARATIAAPIGSEQYSAKGDIVYANCSAFLKSDRCNNSFTVPYEVAELSFNRTSDQVLYSLAAEKAVNSLSNKELAELQSRRTLLVSEIEVRRQLFKALKIQDDLKEAEDFARELESVELMIDRHEQSLESIKQAAEKTESDFYQENPEESELTEAVQKAFTELTNNTVNFRNALKDYGYKIFAGRPDDNEGNGVLQVHGNTYRIERRAQKLGCYIVKAIEADDFGGYDTVQLEARRKPVRK